MVAIQPPSNDIRMAPILVIRPMAVVLLSSNGIRIAPILAIYPSYNTTYVYTPTVGGSEHASMHEYIRIYTLPTQSFPFTPVSTHEAPQTSICTLTIGRLT